MQEWKLEKYSNTPFEAKFIVLGEMMFTVV